MSNKIIDEIDKNVLRMLQNDARTPFKEIADKCNVSTDTIKNRFNMLKKNGIIRGTTILIATHDERLKFCSDRIIHMEDGILLN